MMVIKAVRSDSLALQLGQLHFNADYLRSHVVVMNMFLPDSFA